MLAPTSGQHAALHFNQSKHVVCVSCTMLSRLNASAAHLILIPRMNGTGFSFSTFSKTGGDWSQLVFFFQLQWIFWVSGKDLSFGYAERSSLQHEHGKFRKSQDVEEQFSSWRRMNSHLLIAQIMRHRKSPRHAITSLIHPIVFRSWVCLSVLVWFDL